MIKNVFCEPFYSLECKVCGINLLQKWGWTEFSNLLNSPRVYFLIFFVFHNYVVQLHNLYLKILNMSNFPQIAAFTDNSNTILISMPPSGRFGFKYL